MNNKTMLLVVATLSLSLIGCATQSVPVAPGGAVSAQEFQRIKAEVTEMSFYDEEETRPGETFDQQLDRIRKEAARRASKITSVQALFNEAEGMYGELYRTGQLCYVSMKRESSSLMFCRTYLRVQARLIGTNDVLGPRLKEAKKRDPEFSVASNGNFEKTAGVMKVVLDALNQRAAKL